MCVNRPLHLCLVVCQNLIVNPCKIIKDVCVPCVRRHQMVEVEWFMSSLLVHARWCISICALASCMSICALACIIRDAVYADGGVIWLAVYADAAGVYADAAAVISLAISLAIWLGIYICRCRKRHRSLDWRTWWFSMRDRLGLPHHIIHTSPASWQPVTCSPSEDGDTW